jgi:hypothetical protein
MPAKRDKGSKTPLNPPKGETPKGEKRHRKSKKLADNSNKATSKSTVIIINEKPKRKRRNTKRKTETTQILQPIHVHQPYYFNPYEFHYSQNPQKVIEVNRQAALDTFDQNRSEEAKSALASLGISPPGVPPLEPRSWESPGLEARAPPGWEARALAQETSPLERMIDTTPNPDRRLPINPPSISAFTLGGETHSLSSDSNKPNISRSEIHAIGSYTPGKLDNLRKKFEELEAFAGTPGKKTVYNSNLLKISKEIAETFYNDDASKKLRDLVQKSETGTRANYKHLELEVRDFLSKDHNLSRVNPRITSTSVGTF